MRKEEASVHEKKKKRFNFKTFKRNPLLGDLPLPFLSFLFFFLCSLKDYIKCLIYSKFSLKYFNSCSWNFSHLEYCKKLLKYNQCCQWHCQQLLFYKFLKWGFFILQGPVKKNLIVSMCAVCSRSCNASVLGLGLKFPVLIFFVLTFNAQLPHYWLCY